MESAMQIISNETVRSDTVKDLQDFNSQSLSTQTKKEKISFDDAYNLKSFRCEGGWYIRTIYRKRCFKKQNRLSR